MARDDWWQLGGVVIGGHSGPEETHTRGESYSLDTFLTGEADSPTGAWPDHVDRYRQLREYQPHAGQFVLYEAIDSTFYYREQHENPLSLLVAVRPPADTQTGLGGWYLVSGVPDATMLPDAVCQLGFELTYLTALDNYATAADVRAALEATGP